MDLLFYILIGIAGIIALWLIFKLLGGCLLRIFLGIIVIAVAVFVAIFLIKC